MKIDFDGLPPESRALILVASDDAYRALAAQIDPLKIAKLAAPLLLPGGLIGAVFGPAASASAYLASTWATVAAARRLGGRQEVEVGEPRSIIDRLIRRGDLPVPHLAPEEAARRFRFDPGGPRDGAAYVLNPFVRDHYLAPANANERLAQEKVSAFMRIGSALGARTIEILSADAVSRSGKGGADVPLPQRATQIGLHVSFDARGAVNRQVLMEFDAPRVAPHVPEDLRGFLDADPVLRALVTTRLEGRPRRARVSLQLGDAIDVDAGVTEGLARRGVHVGGKYRRVATSVWHFEIEYYPVEP